MKLLIASPVVSNLLWIISGLWGAPHVSGVFETITHHTEFTGYDKGTAAAYDEQTGNENEHNNVHWRCVFFVSRPSLR